jgi:hypothetical protein
MCNLTGATYTDMSVTNYKYKHILYFTECVKPVTTVNKVILLSDFRHLHKCNSKRNCPPHHHILFLLNNVFHDMSSVRRKRLRLLFEETEPLKR